MADNTLRDADRADVAAGRNEEPATSHDVGAGGAIGLVGGAVVGGLAGGPVGAVIGAVAGGLASAGAVDVVDKHDHDYDRMVAGTSASGASTYADNYDTDYRTDYQSRYANTGAPYEQYQPAYQYGHSLAADPRYQNGDWDTVQTGARTDWETRYPGEGGWDRFKDSVRYAWDRARGRTGTQNVGTTGGVISGDGPTVYATGSNSDRL